MQQEQQQASLRQDGGGSPLPRARQEKSGAAAAVCADGVCILDGKKRVPRDRLVIVPVGNHATLTAGCEWILDGIHSSHAWRT